MSSEASSFFSQNDLSFLKSLCADSGLEIFPIHGVRDDKTCTCQKRHNCTSAGKHPYLNVSWQSIASNNFERFYKTYGTKRINVAVATGRKSEKSGKYLIVVDVDNPQHEILKTLPQDTIRYRTGSGGYHYWFWSSKQIKNSVSLLAKKVDVRGTGGYVIIPPSRHVSGGKYTLLSQSNQKIADLPKDIESQLEENRNAQSKGVKKSSSVKAAKQISSVSNIVREWWVSSPINDIRTALNVGIKIPTGVRNNSIHRILSSDRAKGVVTYEELKTLATGYAAKCEMPETMDEKELKNIVSSVMRYKPYNTKHENINKIYCLWMKNKKGMEVSEEKLNNLDNLFFSSLKKTENNYSSLEFIIGERKKWYEKNLKMKDGFAAYTTNLLAKKLVSLGFSRKRTNKGNVWDCELPDGVLSICQTFLPTKSTATTMEFKMNMSDSASNSSSENDTSNSENDTSNEVVETTEGTSEPERLGPDGSPLRLLEEREEVIEAKRKWHPNANRYLGRKSTQEIQSATIKYLSSLSPEDMPNVGTSFMSNEERTRDFFDFLEVGDVVGYRAMMFKIEEKTDDTISGQALKISRDGRETSFTGPFTSVNIWNLDFALSISACELLYRNDKPYGVENDMAYKVKVRVYEDSHGRTYVFRSGKELDKSNTSKNTVSDESAK